MDPLEQAAWQARGNACCDRSRFAVGAAIQAEDGRIFGGCNIENVSYGLTVCAERVALWKGLSEGARRFRRIVIVTEAQGRITTPCGACRQLLWEYCGNIELTAINRHHSRSWKLADLFPHPFDLDSLT